MTEQQGSAVATPSNWNVPNALTALRIAMVPVFGWALLHHGGESQGWRWLAYGLFVVAMITDKIDGDIARKHNLVTNFGKIADPIADKAITGMAFIGLSVIGALWWWVTILVLVREWSVTAARLSIARQVVMAARQSGKVKTMAQALALGGFVAPFKDLTGGWDVPGDVVWWIAAVLMAVAVALTVSSGVEFVRDVMHHRRTVTGDSVNPPV
ncbi:MAG: CDP-diacylglycerol--glycerol-3-phosphate 3-phosphatidyltransferase [Propionibacteriales bacterium]|jgi:CDP-diacylglycerol--glycerol-3-phosphate 3-phosphatidyltransferase|nr:CDP-diacylglycerol--glycerol-3-phosphate 3-phosphatidyltransferase [Propionibacteriales bacterium]